MKRTECHVVEYYDAKAIQRFFQMDPAGQVIAFTILDILSDIPSCRRRFRMSQSTPGRLEVLFVVNTDPSKLRELARERLQPLNLGAVSVHFEWGAYDVQ